jgi:hypothetical protein
MALSMRRDGNTISLSLAIAIQVLERIPQEQRPRTYIAMRLLLLELADQPKVDLYLDSAAALIEQAFNYSLAANERLARRDGGC